MATGLTRDKQMKFYRTLLGSILLIMISAGAYGDDDHERARQLLEAGDILPLQQILKNAREIQPGKVLEVELETEHDRPVYEIKLLTDQGEVVKLLFDASTGKPMATGKED